MRAREAADERTLPVHVRARIEAEALGDDFISLLIQQTRIDGDAITTRAIERNGETLLGMRGQFDGDAPGLAVSKLSAGDFDNGIETRPIVLNLAGHGEPTGFRDRAVGRAQSVAR